MARMMRAVSMMMGWRFNNASGGAAGGAGTTYYFLGF